MSNPHDLQDEEPSLDPAAERIRQKMVRLLMGSLAVMFLGLLAVFGAIVYKIGSGSDNAVPIAETNGQPGEALSHSISLPPHQRIISTDLSGQFVLYSLDIGDSRQKSVIVNWQTGKIVSELLTNAN